jgi:hypothetical protein
MCFGSMRVAPSKSAIVRATFNILGHARALGPCLIMARSSSRSQSDESPQKLRMWLGAICALQYSLAHMLEANLRN